MTSSPFFFFNDTATTEIYTLSLHDALPICSDCHVVATQHGAFAGHDLAQAHADRKSTRLNSSHSQISYAVFCLKKKKKKYRHEPRYAQSPSHRALLLLISTTRTMPLLLDRP